MFGSDPGFPANQEDVLSHWTTPYQENTVCICTYPVSTMAH